MLRARSNLQLTILRRRRQECGKNEEWMSYVEKNLISGENLIYRTGVHWSVLFWPVVGLELAGILLWAMAMPINSSDAAQPSKRFLAMFIDSSPSERPSGTSASRSGYRFPW